MLTKIPDYVISDCGYPKWNSERDQLSLAKIHENLWSTSSIWSTNSTSLAKLLPLRETLSDYYMDKLMTRQNQSIYNTIATKTTLQCKKNNSNNSGRPAHKHVNEAIKSGKRKQQEQCALDKRRSCKSNIDKDLDQF